MKSKLTLASASISMLVSMSMLMFAACGFSVMGDPGALGGGDASADSKPNRASPNDDGSLPSDPSDGDAGLTDADPDTGAPQQVITLVQSAHAPRMGSTLSATFPAPTKTGSLIVVLVTYSNTAAPVANVYDNAPGATNLFANAALRSVQGTCQAAEIWYARNARADATTVTVVMSGTSGGQDVWLMEVSGLSSTGGVDKGGIGNSSSTGNIVAPTILATGTPAFFAAVVASCGTIGTIVPPNPFIALPIEDGNTSAYYIATTSPGPFGPVFTNNNAGWNASVAAFR